MTTETSTPRVSRGFGCTRDPAGAAPVFSIVQARWTPPSFARSTRLRLDDLQVGDAVNLKLTRDDGWGTPTVESGGVTLTAEPSPLALPGLPTTGYALIGNDLWLRIVHVGGNTDVDMPETDNAHMQTRMARKLPNGDYLVPHLLAHCVKQYTAKGEVVATIRTDLAELGGRKAENWPFTAIRLRNGNTLVGCTHGNKVCEFDAGGKVVWKVDNDDVGGIIDDACGVQRLPNGNTVIASYHATPGVKLLEVDRHKNVVWRYFGKHRVHHFQVLTTNGEPLPGAPMR